MPRCLMSQGTKEAPVKYRGIALWQVINKHGNAGRPFNIFISYWGFEKWNSFHSAEQAKREVTNINDENYSMFYTQLSPLPLCSKTLL